MSIATPEAEAGLTPAQVEARERIYAAPLETLDPANEDAFPTGEMFWKFERLRREDPVHFTPAEHTEFGHYWSLTKWDDIQAADTNFGAFSAEGIIPLAKPVAPEDRRPILDAETLSEAEAEAADAGGIRSLLSMDPPEHEIHRGAVAEGVSPANLRAMEPLIRERAGKILDGLPIGEEFDWVDKVSIELTSMTLATLFDFPQEQRRTLTFWSNVITSPSGPGMPTETLDERQAAMRDFFETFTDMFHRRRSEDQRLDFVSLLAHSPHAKDFTDGELLGDGIVLLVGGNDTTRNTISGSVYALNKYPSENAKLRANPALIPSMVSETIRWQTPLTHMARRTTRDVEMGGKVIPKGDRVAMWFVSGNRDEDKIENADAYIIDRKNPR
ncbi:MAG: cytochrome P450, partial [Frankiaceae bacterium]|nr:cytochrome P450 [Frankiaceae bacterium]